MNKLLHPSRLLVPLVLITAAAACDRAPTTAPSGLPGDGRFLRAADPVPGRYVVVFRDDQVSSAAALAGELVPAHGGKLHYSYDHALKGFAADLSPAAVEAMLANPRVAYVAQDELVSMDGTQGSAPWGLDRIDQRGLPLSTTYTYFRTGQGVTAYVIDSGILTTHAQFGGRATVGIDFVGDGKNGQDCHGHGTHVAGTIGGAAYGVAKGVRLVSVRVFDCAGSSVPSSITIAAVDWVTANAAKPAVVNMSLSGGANPAINLAVQNSIAAGITYAVAAGNQDMDACGRSPASTPTAITVASTTSGDERSSFSNWGSCVDVFAPGSDITSAWWTGTTAIHTISGTSMATPHVAGVAALYLEAHPAATPAAVAAAIVGSASADRVGDAAGSPNRLLFLPPAVDLLQVNPGALQLAVLQPVAGGAPAGSSAAGQAFTASGAGAARRDGGTDGGGVGTAASASRPLVLTNHGATPLAWSAIDSVGWMSVSPSGGTLAAGAGVTLNVTVNAGSLVAGTHHATLVLAGGGQSREVPVTVAVTAISRLFSGVAAAGLSGAYTSQRYFGITVPGGADSLVITLSGGGGDADLYVRRGALPTVGRWDCRPYMEGNHERCAAAEPARDNYYVMLRGYDAYSGVTLQATVFGAPALPAAPAGVAARGAGPLRVNVTWADSSDDETFFRVRRTRRNPDGTFAAYQAVGQRGTDNTILLDSTAVVGATYRYQVQACNEGGCTGSAPSAPITIVQPPAAPAGLGAAVVPGGQVNLAWTDASGNESQFRVRRATRNPDGTFAAYGIIRTLPAGTTAYADTSAALGTVYRYQVQACNGAGCGASKPVTVRVPLLPPAPTGVSAVAVSPSLVNLLWTDASSNESQFRIRRTIRNPDGSYAPYQTVATLSGGVTSHADATVTAGAIHRYIVQACNASGCSNSISVRVAVPGS